MSKKPRYLHFHLGPVQGFVAQARRSRDVWGGSYLLSWLSGQAMAAVIKQGGDILVPEVSGDPMLAAILDDDVGTTETLVGSLPNGFTARLPDDMDPNACAQAVRDAWRGLARAVWEQFIDVNHVLADHQQRALTTAIWDRQVGNADALGGFWDIAWVVTASPDDAGALARRKAWRGMLPLDLTDPATFAAEGGSHCMIMGDYQELSGHLRREDQNKFWAALAEGTKTNAGDATTLQLRDGERLCATALIKRLFPRLDHRRLGTALGYIPGDDTRSYYPSTRFMAALPWLKVIAGEPRVASAVDAYVTHVTALDKARAVAEAHQRIPSMRDMTAPILSLDAGLFYQTELDALTRGQGEGLGLTFSEHLKNLLKAVKQAHPKALQHRPGWGPSAFYAVLLMDGDLVGESLRGAANDAEDVKQKRREKVTSSLKDFTRQVDGLVGAHDGLTIYAGGDDVLAFLPITQALPAARALHEAYTDCWQGDKPSTLSAAIIFAEATVPLRLVLQTAHTTLEDIAKKANGRNSFCLTLLKPGGQKEQWTSSWHPSAEGAPLPDVKLMTEARRLSESPRPTPVFSSGFLYRTRALLAPFNGKTLGDEEARLLHGMLAAELYRLSEKKGEEDRQEAHRLALFLVDLCKSWPGTGGEARITAAPATFLRFLSREGIWV